MSLERTIVFDHHTYIATPKARRSLASVRVGKEITNDYHQDSVILSASETMTFNTAVTKIFSLNATGIVRLSLIKGVVTLPLDLQYCALDGPFDSFSISNQGTSAVTVNIIYS